MPALWRAFVTRAVTRLVGLLVALGFVVVALGFAFAGLYLWLAGLWGAISAAFAVAGLCLLLALLVLAVVALANRGRPAARAPGGAMLGADAGAFVRGHRKQTLLAALACGFVLGVSPRARRGLWRLLR